MTGAHRGEHDGVGDPPASAGPFRRVVQQQRRQDDGSDHEGVHPRLLGVPGHRRRRDHEHRRGDRADGVDVLPREERRRRRGHPHREHRGEAEGRVGRSEHRRPGLDADVVRRHHGVDLPDDVDDAGETPRRVLRRGDLVRPHGRGRQPPAVPRHGDQEHDRREERRTTPLVDEGGTGRCHKQMVPYRPVRSKYSSGLSSRTARSRSSAWSDPAGCAAVRVPNRRASAPAGGSGERTPPERRAAAGGPAGSRRRWAAG